MSSQKNFFLVQIALISVWCLKKKKKRSRGKDKSHINQREKAKTHPSRLPRMLRLKEQGTTEVHSMNSKMKINLCDTGEDRREEKKKRVYNTKEHFFDFHNIYRHALWTYFGFSLDNFTLNKIRVKKRMWVKKLLAINWHPVFLIVTGYHRNFFLLDFCRFWFRPEIKFSCMLSTSLEKYQLSLELINRSCKKKKTEFHCDEDATVLW